MNKKCPATGDIYASSGGERVWFRKFRTPFDNRITFNIILPSCLSCLLRYSAFFCFSVLPRCLELLSPKSTKLWRTWLQRRRTWTESWRATLPWIQSNEWPPIPTLNIPTPVLILLNPHSDVFYDTRAFLIRFTRLRPQCHTTATALLMLQEHFSGLTSPLYSMSENGSGFSSW